MIQGSDCAECESFGYPGHPRSTHQGNGPCLVALGRTGKQLDQKAKGSPKDNPICPCTGYRPSA